MNHWQNLQRLFGEAVALDASARAAFIEQACQGDAALAAALRRLLAGDAAGDAPVQAAIGQAAVACLGGVRQAAVGLRLGPWRIESHIADGGMGAVYHAVRADGGFTQHAALKLLNPARVSAAARERLAQERQILARLVHPNIARLLDGGTTPDGLPYLVMEFVDGLPIDAWCQAKGLDTRARLLLFVQVCGAVDHAHRNFIVHRDLKPSNILVDHDGQPKLLDFGIAKLLDGVDGDSLTRSGEQVLTPSHASPEQITGGAITTATDVYALGVLLYDLLCGRRPHPESTGSAAALARAIVETEPLRPSQAVTDAGRAAGPGMARLARELRGDLDNIVLMALRKEPARRYASAQALADDVRRHLSHLPVHARPDTPAYRSLKFWRRHPVAVPLTTLALVLAAGGSAGFAWRLASERDRARAAEVQARQAAERARRAGDFTASILENTAADADAARQVSVQTLLSTAARRVGEELQAQPEVATRMRIALGTAMHSWGQYDDALRELQMALDEARSRGAAGERDLAEVLSLLGTVSHDLGRVEAALDWYRQAQAAWQHIGAASEQAAALRDVALALNGVGRAEEARPVFRAALDQMQQAYPGDHVETAWLLNNMAWGLHMLGRLDEAAPLYERALAMQTRLGIAPSERTQTQINLAALHYDRGELDTAERQWRDALQQLESVYGLQGHLALARARSVLALVLIDRGAADEALRLTASALDTVLRAADEYNPRTSAIMEVRAMALLGAHRLDDAARWLQRAAAARRKALPVGDAGHVGTHLGLAELALALGRPRQAEAEFRRALQVVEGLSTPGRLPLERIQLGLGRSLALQGQRAAGLDMARRALAYLRARRAPGHWRLRAAEAGLGLPPFVAVASADAVARAHQALATLRQQVGVNAPVVRELEAQLVLQRRAAAGAR